MKCRWRSVKQAIDHSEPHIHNYNTPVRPTSHRLMNKHTPTVPSTQRGAVKTAPLATLRDKPARRAASRRTCYKQIRWMPSAINFDGSKLTAIRVESRQFLATAPAFNVRTPPAFGASVGVTPFEFCRDFGIRKLHSLCYCVALFA